jgi:hypothetical protein
MEAKAKNRHLLVFIKAIEVHLIFPHAPRENEVKVETSDVKSCLLGAYFSHSIVVHGFRRPAHELNSEKHVKMCALAKEISRSMFRNLRPIRASLYSRLQKRLRMSMSAAGQAQNRHSKTKDDHGEGVVYSRVYFRLDNGVLTSTTWMLSENRDSQSQLGIDWNMRGGQSTF